MPRTIFGKLLVTHIAILLINVVLSLVVTFVFLSNFLSTEKVKLLQQTGDRINNILNFYIDNGAGRVLQSMTENVIDNYALNTNSAIWVATPTGEIAFISKKTVPAVVLKKLTYDGLNYLLPDEKHYKDNSIKEGLVIKGSFYGLFEGTDMTWVTVIRPFYHNTVKEGEKHFGAVYLSTQLPELRTAHVELLSYYLISALISISITTIVIYVVSLKISRPLTDIKNAAKDIASGNFNNTLNYVSKDEIGELSRSFNDMAVDLKNLDEVRRTFTANVSHELRTPMTSIAGFVDGMIDGTIPSDKFHEYLKIVSQETKRLIRMTNDTLELAKMDSGEVELEYIKFGINELIRRCIIKMDLYLEAKKMQIQTDISHEEIFVNADVDAIERVLLNLIHNATKFTNEGGKITFKTRVKSNKVYISIIDTGIGISKEDQELIWDRFYKTDRSRGQDKEGSGLGLSIVKNIISRHGQNIWVESERDKGTKFTFTLENYV